MPSPARSAHIVDTRKTTPGLRAIEKYAVRCGGGSNHRVGLFDAVLIKDNHIVAAGGLAAAIEAARATRRHMVKIEVEVDTLAQIDEALKHKRRRRAARQHDAGTAAGRGAGSSKAGC